MYFLYDNKNNNNNISFEYVFMLYFVITSLLNFILLTYVQYDTCVNEDQSVNQSVLCLYYCSALQVLLVTQYTDLHFTLTLQC